jgi:hypothetical protein
VLIGTFLLALLLAWPTFGISLAVWLAFAWMSAKGTSYAKNSLDDGVEQLKRKYFVGESQADFMRVLAGDQESYALTVLNDEEMIRLANIMIRYMATHPDMRMEFEAIVSRYESLRAFGPPDPACGRAVQAITIERNINDIGGKLHYFCYQIIQNLRINNPDHSLLRRIDLEELDSTLDTLEMSMQHEREMGRSLF